MTSKTEKRKAELKIAINFISSKEYNEECVMQSKSNNREFMIYDNADDIIGELFQLLLSWHQLVLEASVRDSDVIFDCVHLLF